MDMVSIPTIMSTTSSCRPHHHLNHIIMSTTHHQAVGKCNSSEACEFTGEKTIGRETLSFLGSVAPGVAQVFPRVRGSIWESCRQKVHRTVARARFALQNFNKIKASEHFWKMRPEKCALDCSERSIAYNTGKKTGMFGVTRNRLHCQRCAYVGRFSVTFLLRGFAIGCEKTRWQGCGQQSMSDAAALLATGIAAATAGGC